MSFNRALLDYIFKSKNDSPSVESSELIKELRQEKKAGIFNSNSYKDIAVQEFSTEFEINKIAEKYNGGGHKLASGARLVSFEEVEYLIKDLDKACENYIKESEVYEN